MNVNEPLFYQRLNEDKDKQNENNSNEKAKGLIFKYITNSQYTN